MKYLFVKFLKFCHLEKRMSATKGSYTHNFLKFSILLFKLYLSKIDEKYAAECTKHNLLYIGQSSQKLNCRFNGHRSDLRVKPKACEPTQHFSQNKNCSINKDMKVYILQDNLEGSSFERMEFFEDHWMTRLDTKVLMA